MWAIRTPFVATQMLVYCVHGDSDEMHLRWFDDATASHSQSPFDGDKGIRHTHPHGPCGLHSIRSHSVPSEQSSFARVHNLRNLRPRHQTFGTRLAVTNTKLCSLTRPQDNAMLNSVPVVLVGHQMISLLSAECPGAVGHPGFLRLPRYRLDTCRKTPYGFRGLIRYRSATMRL